MAKLTLRRDALILVCDGRTALVIRNAGPPGREKFEVEHTVRQDLPAHSAQMGSDRPGLLRQNSGGPGSAIEPTDLHAEQEKAFIKDAWKDFTARHALKGDSQIVVVAPPKALAVIRELESSAIRVHIIAEINKDLTRHPVEEIQRLVLG